MAPSQRLLAAKPRLDQLYADFNRAASDRDPVEFAWRFDAPADREVVAFISAALAFGRVASILASIGRVLDRLGASPAGTLRDFSPARERARYGQFVHRWIGPDEIVALLHVLGTMLREAGSLEAAFAGGDDPAAPDVGPAIEQFSTRARAIGGPAVACFFPRPSAGSACKRINLFLRWMVRRDALDPGGWTRVSPSRLVIPLDTHVIRVGQCLGLTRRRTPGWTMAGEVTAALRRLDPADPVRYDFALCRLGMKDWCGSGRPGRRRDADCPLRGLCRPARGTPRASARPSVRP
jgi:uncharacterized protein (TIGR02757 family)